MALALAAQGSADPSALVWLAAIAALVFAYSLQEKAPLQPSLLAIAVAFFAVWIVVTNQWSSPSYTAAGPYHAAFLVAGFVLARRSGLQTIPSLYSSALLGGVVLSEWALWQALQGERAHALFETPATLAATLNLVLLPGLVYFAWSRRSTLLAAGLVLLLLALAAAQSRGGWLAFGAGATAALLLARRAGLPVSARAVWPLCFLAAAGLALCVHGITSSQARLALYQTALQSMASPLLGTGYLSFYYHLEPLRPGVFGYADATTYFVHNDYLQTLLELGVPGLLGLLALVLLPLVLAWRAVVHLSPEKKIVLIAASAAIVATATHALVDYPFYVPVCLLLFGGAVGALDSVFFHEKPIFRFHKIPRAIVAALCIWVLVTPVIAEAAARYAERQWRAQHAQSAAYWFELARRVTPRDWRYHWYAGQFWRAVATDNGNRRAAELADAAFAAGRVANPRELRLLEGGK